MLRRVSPVRILTIRSCLLLLSVLWWYWLVIFCAWVNFRATVVKF